MPELGNQPGLSESQLSQLQRAFENKPADTIRGQFTEAPETLLAATKKKPTKKKPKSKARPRPKAKAKSQVV
jgi:hypothetical protein